MTAVVAGLGSALPAREVGNDELAARLGVTPDWIERRTGIRARRFADAATPTSALAAEAARAALADAATDPSEVDAFLVATYTPDHQIPATAPLAAARLGIGAPAFDVNAACSGFVYALATAAGLIATGARRVLVAGAETASTLTDPADRTVHPLFGDGAGAVLLRAGEPGEEGALLAVDLGSDGAGAASLIAPASASRARLGNGTERPQPDPAAYYMAMDGREVFLQAVAHMSASSRAVLARAEVKPSEVDRVCGHQANVRILRAVADELGADHDRLLVDLDRVGNTGAASIPLALDRARREGRLAPGHTVLLTAFGGGYTWGSALLRWPATAQHPRSAP
ncbi:beta-ketoacyl-ACP synthase III [Glycomyces terrestris]|uniref:Beta-ketoacyl-[acyl-carrier-protein] synthase III n=1 Tax=Glycomyces terrestris TaxID=2493553 RepID=A0A426V0Y1_9ACTN|nr:beta-ketoacyl-ACP synthase III [Glycomyces terrestris]RRS00524.1 ketoacyl-ACP synthase III [Glycomyces terrestris]